MNISKLIFISLASILLYSNAYAQKVEYAPGSLTRNSQISNETIRYEWNNFTSKSKAHEGESNDAMKLIGRNADAIRLDPNGLYRVSFTIGLPLTIYTGVNIHNAEILNYNLRNRTLTIVPNATRPVRRCWKEHNLFVNNTIKCTFDQKRVHIKDVYQYGED